MAVSPRARRQLAAVDRRVKERRAQLAPQWRHAEEVGRHLEHAEVSAIHRREIAHVPSRAMGALGIIILLSAFPFVAVIVSTPHIPRAAALLYGGAAVAAAVACFVRAFRHERVEWVYVYPDGLAVIGWDGSLQAHLRWLDVVGADWSWSTHGDSAGGRVDGVELRTASGWRLPLSSRYRNALDPYALVGAMVAAMAPRSVGSTFPRFPTLAEAVDAAVVERLVAQVLARCGHGERLGFGPVMIDGVGISLDGSAPVRWEDVTTVTVASMRLRIERSDGGRPLKVWLNEVPDGWVLVRSIMARTAPAAEPPR